MLDIICPFDIYFSFFLMLRRHPGATLTSFLPYPPLFLSVRTRPVRRLTPRSHHGNPDHQHLHPSAPEARAVAWQGPGGFDRRGPVQLDPDDVRPGPRSEEHTSELQSLMRITSAVFCLKNKTIQRA